MKRFFFENCRWPRKICLVLMTIAIGCASYGVTTKRDAFLPNKRVTGVVYIPEINRSVHYTKDFTTKQYIIDYRDLADVKLQMRPIEVSKCSAWYNRAKPLNRLDGMWDFFQRSKVRFHLKVFRMNPTAISNAFGPGWKNAGYLGGNIKIGFVWKRNSITQSWGPRLVSKVEEYVQNLFVAPPTLSTIADNGEADFMVQNSPFVCDILDNKVALTLTFQGYQQVYFGLIPNVDPQQIVAVSRLVVHEYDRLKAIDGNFISDDFWTQQVQSGGLLGIALHRVGMAQTVFDSGMYTDLSNDIFKNGTDQPRVLSRQQASKLLKRSIQFSIHNENFTFTRNLTSAVSR